MPAKFDAERFRELVLYIAWRTRGDARFGRTKLAKTLFYADFQAYADEGEPITGARYEHWQFGPFPPVLYGIEEQLVVEGLADELRKGSGGEDKLIVSAEPATPHVDPWHKAFVDLKIAELAPLTAKQISDHSHEHPGWELTADKEEIPYAAALVPEKPSPEAMEIAKRRFAMQG